MLTDESLNAILNKLLIMETNMRQFQNKIERTICNDQCNNWTTTIKKPFCGRFFQADSIFLNIRSEYANTLCAGWKKKIKLIDTCHSNILSMLKSGKCLELWDNIIKETNTSITYIEEIIEIVKCLKHE